MAKGNNGLYFGGIPTEPDVKKLMEAYPEESLIPGTEIPYSGVDAIIGVEYGNGRWQGVTNAWRKRVESDWSIVIGHTLESIGRAFVVLDNDQKFDLGKRQTRSGLKRVKRGYIVTGTLVDRASLSDERKAAYDNLMMKQAAILSAQQIGRKKITASMETPPAEA